MKMKKKNDLRINVDCCASLTCTVFVCFFFHTDLIKVLCTHY